MIGRTNAGGGAGLLNFRVLGGTTQPTNLRENDLWVNTDTAISSWDFSATEPQRRSNNKNLLVHPYDNSDTTISGITFKPFTGGTVGVSGKATAQATFYLNDKNPLALPAGTYTFSGAMEGGGASTWVVGLKYSYDDFKTPVYSTTGTSQTITFDKSVKVIMYLQVKNGVTASGNFRPQIEKGTVATSFVKGDATGQVWISTGASSAVEFNALKKNNITVYPISAKQYNGSAWVEKEVKSYQNGALADWIRYMYNKGNQFTDVTGGWTAYGDSAQVTFNSDHILLGIKSGSNETWGMAHTVNKIDITGISTLYFYIDERTSTDITESSNSNSKYSTVGISTSPDVRTSGWTAYKRVPSGTTKTLFEVDVSAYSGTYYVCILNAVNASGHMKCSQVYGK